MKTTATARPRRAAKPRRATVQMMPVLSVYPSEENDQIYRPVDTSDPAIIDLAKSIRKYGVQEPIVVTRERFILSGHRRRAAAILAGINEVPVIVRDDVSAHEDRDGYLCVLREYNRQRVKSFDEQMREEAISADPEESYRVLVEQRKQKSDMVDFQLEVIDLGDRKVRKQVSSAKWPLLNAVLRVIDGLREYWPLSDRAIHYALLNNPPLKHARKRGSTYANDQKSYKNALVDILTRGRLDGSIPWEAIGDDTRLSQDWGFHWNVSTFVAHELDRFCKNYYRNLQQSQPRHIEIFAEKFTVEKIVTPIAAEFCIPLTIGKGMCSVAPRHNLAGRFRKSGRDELVVLLMSDHDPAGENISLSFARSMRDDFHIDTDRITAVKVALTPDQVERHQLPQSMLAKRATKKQQAHSQKFIDKHGDGTNAYTYELEALPPETLKQLLRDAIESVLDHEAFDHEVEQEKQEAAKLDVYRRTVVKMLTGVKL